MMRLFVALELPQEVRLRMAALGGGLPGARWVAAEAMHLTLRFIGEVDEGRVEDIAHGLDRLRAPAFEIWLDDVGFFGTGRKVHTLWVGVARNDLLDRLQGKIETALVNLGLPPEPRKFKPHVTLARLRNGNARAAEAFVLAHAGFRAGPLPITAFSLIRSYLGKGGPVYETLAEYPLDSAVG
jgi:2'-5' RNA ligase